MRKYSYLIMLFLFVLAVVLSLNAETNSSPSYDDNPPAYIWGTGTTKPQTAGTPTIPERVIIENISIDTTDIRSKLETQASGTTKSVTELVKEIKENIISKTDLTETNELIGKNTEKLVNGSGEGIATIATEIEISINNLDTDIDEVVRQIKPDSEATDTFQVWLGSESSIIKAGIASIDSKLAAEIGSETNSIAQMFADNASSTVYPWDAYFYWGTEGYPQDDAFLVPRNMAGLMCNLMDMLMFYHSAGEDSYTFETFPTALFREYYDAADDQMKYFSLIDTLMRWKTDEESGNEEPVYISSDVASIAATSASTTEQLVSISDKLTFKEETESGTVEHDINEALFANSKSSGATVPLCNVLMGEVSGSGETIGEMTTKILSSVFQEESSSAEATSVLKEFKNINNASDSIIVTSANNIVAGLQTEIASVAAAVASVAAKIEEVNTTSVFTSFSVSINGGTPTQINPWTDAPSNKHRQYVELTAPNDDDIFYIGSSSSMTISNSRKCRGRIMLRLLETAPLYVLSADSVNLIQTEGY